MADPQRASSAQDQAGADFRSGLAAQNSGRLKEAVEAYHRVLNQEPEHVGGLHNLGMILLEQGKAGVALCLIRRAIELQPTVPEMLNSLGNAYRHLQRWREAEEAYLAAADLRADYVVPLFNLAVLLGDLGREPESEALYRQVLANNPRHLKALINLSSHLRYREPGAAIDLVRRAIEIDPKSHLAHNNHGNFLRDLDRLDEAARSYLAAVEADPAFAVGWLNLGTVLSHLGRSEEAIPALRRAIELAPERGEPYFQLAVATKVKLDDPAVAAMQKLYDDQTTSPEDRMFAAFALGRIFDGNEKFDEAFACWDEGNRLKLAAVDFDINKEERIVREVKTYFTREFLATAPRSSITDDTPIFVVGMIRSGTTLMEQILASHPEVVGADENTWLPDAIKGLRRLTAEELTRVGQSYIDKMRTQFGPKPRFIVDKLVGNWLQVGYITLAIPNAKIICMRRNPYDSGLSAFSSLFTQYHEYCYSLEGIARFTNVFREMIDHWESVLPGRVYQVQYESLIAEPEKIVRGVLDHIGLDFDPKCLNFHQTERRVKTASTQQVREKLHSRAVARWRNYEKHLSLWRPYFGEPG